MGRQVRDVNTQSYPEIIPQAMRGPADDAST